MMFAECVVSSISKSVVLVEISLPSETKYYAKKYFTPVNSTHLYEGKQYSNTSVEKIPRTMQKKKQGSH